jgi:hypothetical protein
MLRPLLKSPEHLAAEWPEVFENLYINSLPIGYVELIKVEFYNGRKWEIDLRGDNKQQSIPIQDLVLETFGDFKEEITKLEFTIDVNKLKTDIEIQTKGIF